MTRLLVSIATVSLVLASDPPAPSSLGLFLNRGNSLLFGVCPLSLAVLWTVRLESVQCTKESENSRKPHIRVTKTGEVLLSATTGLERLETGEKECFDTRDDMYVVWDKTESWLWVEPRTGNVHTESDCNLESPLIPIKRLDRTVKLIAKGTEIELSQVCLSDYVPLSPYFHLGKQPAIATLEDAEFLGYWQGSESEESLLPDIETVLLFLCISLGIGFHMGTRAQSNGKLHVKIHRSKLNPLSYSGHSAATTVPCSSPEGSQKSLENGDFEQDEHRHMTLSVLTMRKPAKSVDVGTPTSLHSSSEALISDLLSNGRFKDCFQDVDLLAESQLRTEYRARHRLDRTLYLITVLQFHYQFGQKIAQTAMFREVAAMVRVRNKHIVNYVTCWVEEDEAGLASLYIQSQWIEGNTLKAWLSLRPKPNRHQNCVIFRQILKAIAHIHRKHVVHRGIKPSSIYLSGDLVTVGNFRFAAKAKAKSMTQSQELSQSLYAAPELASEATVAPSIDIYPLGLVLLELCEGQMTIGERRAAFARLKEERKLPAEVEEGFPIESELILQLTSEETSRPDASSLLESPLFRSWELEVGCSPRSGTPSPHLSPS